MSMSMFHVGGVGTPRWAARALTSLLVSLGTLLGDAVAPAAGWMVSDPLVATARRSVFT
jgi:hypothetical protein